MREGDNGKLWSRARHLSANSSHASTGINYNINVHYSITTDGVNSGDGMLKG